MFELTQLRLQSLRFEIEELNAAQVGSQISDAFVRFVAEVLQAEYPGIVALPERGKDGAIDLFQEARDGRKFGEAKLVGSDKVADVKARWRKVAERLERN